MPDLNLQQQEKFATALITTALEALGGTRTSNLTPDDIRAMFMPYVAKDSDGTDKRHFHIWGHAVDLIKRTLPELAETINELQNKANNGESVAAMQSLLRDRLEVLPNKHEAASVILTGPCHDPQYHTDKGGQKYQSSASGKEVDSGIEASAWKLLVGSKDSPLQVISKEGKDFLVWKDGEAEKHQAAYKLAGERFDLPMTPPGNEPLSMIATSVLAIRAGVSDKESFQAMVNIKVTEAFKGEQYQKDLIKNVGALAEQFGITDKQEIVNILNKAFKVPNRADIKAFSDGIGPDDGLNTVPAGALSLACESNHRLSLPTATAEDLRLGFTGAKWFYDNMLVPGVINSLTGAEGPKAIFFREAKLVGDEIVIGPVMQEELKVPDALKSWQYVTDTRMAAAAVAEVNGKSGVRLTELASQLPVPASQDFKPSENDMPFAHAKRVLEAGAAGGTVRMNDNDTKVGLPGTDNYALDILTKSGPQAAKEMADALVSHKAGNIDKEALAKVVEKYVVSAELSVTRAEEITGQKKAVS